MWGQQSSHQGRRFNIKSQVSYQVIARKYRPQIFDEVVGQRLVSETLKNAILTQRVAHSYIFSGARGVGKTTMARILAKSLNCVQGPTVSPCGQCPSCLEIAAGNSVDVLEIDAASNRGIDEIRELRENVRYLPARDRYKVFIIDEVHMLTTEAFNALLKTLEEPPERSLFILATTEAHKLPATIQSRCQHFAFRLLDYSEILLRLQEICAREEVGAADGALSAIAQAADGSLRDALSLLDETIAACGSTLNEEKARQLLGVVPARLMVELIESVRAGDSRAVFEQVSQLGTQGYDLSAFCGELTRFVRNLMIARSCGAESALLQVPDDERVNLGRLSQLFSDEDLARFFQVLLRVQNEMRYALEPRFHLELALIKLVHARKLVAIESLLGSIRNQSSAVSPPKKITESSSEIQEARLSGTTPGRTWGKPIASQSPQRIQNVSGTLSNSGSEAKSAQPSSDTRPVSSYSPKPPPLRPETAKGTPENSTAPEPIQRPPVRTNSADPQLPPPASEDASLTAIKAALFEESKFLSSCLNPLIGWRFENGQAHFLYSRQGSWAAELLQTRQHQEKLRAACEKVLGQPVKICVTLNAESSQPSATPAQSNAQERALRNPAVQAFQKQFDGVLVDVKDLSRE
jgi:DNA polymerase III subunit gamma/tau